MRGFAVSLSLAAGLLTLPVVADAALERVGQPQVSFTATGPAGLKIVGTTQELSVTDDGTNVVVQVPLGNLVTGIALRDKHMREKYLQVDKFPTAELTVPKANLKLPTAGDVSLSTTGTMKLHGQSKPLTFKYTASKGSPVNVSGQVHIEMTDFGIEAPGYLGVTVKPGVDVAVTFRAKGG